MGALEKMRELTSVRLTPYEELAATRWVVERKWSHSDETRCDSWWTERGEPSTEMLQKEVNAFNRMSSYLAKSNPSTPIVEWARLLEFDVPVDTRIAGHSVANYPKRFKVLFTVERQA